MKRLLTIELQKLWKNRASKVLIITYFTLLSCIALLSSINFDIIGINFRLADMGIFNFPYIWHLNTFVAAALKFFLAVVIVSMMSNEYTYGTLKQNLIDGLSKKEFIKSKFYTVLLFSGASTIFVVIMTLILGYSFSSYTEFSIVTTDLEYVAGYFLKLVAFFSFCLFVGTLIKRSAFALGFIIIWFLIEEIFIRFFLLGKLITNDKTVSFIMGFLPLDAMFSLIKEPITRFQAYKALETQVGGVEKVRFYGIHWYEYIIGLVWTAFFIYMSYRILKKRDL
jgi:ABC-2 type transport system permease protein